MHPLITKVALLSRFWLPTGRDRQSTIFQWTWRHALILTLMIAGARLMAEPLPAKVLTSENVYVSTDSLLAGEWTLVYFFRGYW